MNNVRPSTLLPKKAPPGMDVKNDSAMESPGKSPLTRHYMKSTARPDRHTSTRVKRSPSSEITPFSRSLTHGAVSRRRSLFEAKSPKYASSSRQPVDTGKPANNVKQLTDVYACVEKLKKQRDYTAARTNPEADDATIKRTPTKPTQNLPRPLRGYEVTNFPSRSQIEPHYSSVEPTSNGMDGLKPIDENIYGEACAPRLTEHGVLIDTTGYAIPDLRVNECSLSRKAESFKKNQKLEPLKGRFYRPSARLKVRVERAYSVLRPKINNNDHTDNVLSPEDDDSDNDVDIEKHHQKVSHVTRIRKFWEQSKPADRTLLRSFSLTAVAERSVGRLFNYALVVTLTKNGKGFLVPKVLFDYPEQRSSDLDKICQFCFPDSKHWLSKPFPKTEYYTFVLTDEFGTRQFGHCCRIQISDGEDKPDRPEVMCLVCDCRAHDLHCALFNDYVYRRLGKNIVKNDSRSTMHKTISMCVSPNVSCNLNSVCNLLRIAYTRNVDMSDCSSDEKKLGLQFDKANFEFLMNKLTVEQVIQIFASLLLERRIILISKSLSTLSSCLHGIVSLLFPFEWPHTYAPLLPDALMDVCCAPTPFLVGVMSHNLSCLKTLPLDEVLMIDVDNKLFLQSVGDELTIIPKKLRKALKASLIDDPSTPTSCDSISNMNTKDQDVFEGFLRLFVETIGHYKDFVTECKDSKGKSEFDNKAFIKAVKSRTISLFLEWFTETQMFQIFINHYMETMLENDDEFKIRILEYQNEMRKIEKSVRHNFKKMSKKIRNFFIGSGDKLKKVYKNVFI